MVHISPTELFVKDQTLYLSYHVQCFITFTIVQGRWRSCAPSAPAEAQFFRDRSLVWIHSVSDL